MTLQKFKMLPAWLQDELANVEHWQQVLHPVQREHMKNRVVPNV